MYSAHDTFRKSEKAPKLMNYMYMYRVKCKHLYVLMYTTCIYACTQ